MCRAVKSPTKMAFLRSWEAAAFRWLSLAIPVVTALKVTALFSNVEWKMSQALGHKAEPPDSVFQAMFCAFPSISTFSLFDPCFQTSPEWGDSGAAGAPASLAADRAALRLPDRQQPRHPHAGLSPEHRSELDGHPAPEPLALHHDWWRGWPGRRDRVSHVHTMYVNRVEGWSCYK